MLLWTDGKDTIHSLRIKNGELGELYIGKEIEFNDITFTVLQYKTEKRIDGYTYVELLEKV